MASLPAGIYKYRPQGHELEKVAEGDVRAELCAAAIDQECIEDGAAVLVFAAVYERTTRKYGNRGVRYVHMEVVWRLLQMQDDERALCIMPVGRL